LTPLGMPRPSEARGLAPMSGDAVPLISPFEAELRNDVVVTCAMVAPEWKVVTHIL
jgi:hypothetical protein